MPSPNEYSQLNEAASATSRVAQQAGKLGLGVKIGAGALVVGLVGWVIWSNAHRGASVNANQKRFNVSTGFQPPDALNTRAPQLRLGVMHVPPAPTTSLPVAPAQPPVSIAAPSLPQPVSSPVATDNGDAARLAAKLAAERARAAAAAEAAKWARLKAGQIIANNGANVGGNPSGGAPAGRAGSNSVTPGLAFKDSDPNTQFLNGVAAQGVDTVHATKIRRIDALVAQGTTIPAILETAVQSDLAGMVRAITSDDVWSFDGRRVLIPTGTHLIGQYKSGIAQGQTRVFIVWSRLLRPDGVSVQLGSPGTDPMGRAGNGGIVDNHYIERFGSSILLSIIGGASQLIAGLGQNNQQQAQSASTSVTNPITGITTTTTTQPSQASQLNQQARATASQTIAQELTSISQDALKNSIKIPPTIFLDQGTRIVVFVRRDLDFSSLYPDPVQEALQKLRREHGALEHSTP